MTGKTYLQLWLKWLSQAAMDIRFSSSHLPDGVPDEVKRLLEESEAKLSEALKLALKEAKEK